MLVHISIIIIIIMIIKIICGTERESESENHLVFVTLQNTQKVQKVYYVIQNEFSNMVDLVTII